MSEQVVAVARIRQRCATVDTTRGSQVGSCSKPDHSYSVRQAARGRSGRIGRAAFYAAVGRGDLAGVARRARPEGGASDARPEGTLVVRGAGEVAARAMGARPDALGHPALIDGPRASSSQACSHPISPFLGCGEPQGSPGAEAGAPVRAGSTIFRPRWP